MEVLILVADAVVLTTPWAVPDCLEVHGFKPLLSLGIVNGGREEVVAETEDFRRERTDLNP